MFLLPLFTPSASLAIRTSHSVGLFVCEEEEDQEWGVNELRAHTHIHDCISTPVQYIVACWESIYLHLCPPTCTCMYMYMYIYNVLKGMLYKHPPP